MYIHPAFAIDRARALAFAAARGFGLVVACRRGGPVASPLPFHLDYAADGTPHIAFHVARANPLAALAGQDGEWLVAVSGPGAYVSADWYASPEQVPTWLYQTAQLGGPVRVMPAKALADHLEILTQQFEARLAPKPPWRMAALTPARRKMLMKSIVGIMMQVEWVAGSFKLNQHKSDADHVAVAAALAARPEAAARELSASMIAMRPHLTYEGPAAPTSLPHAAEPAASPSTAV